MIFMQIYWPITEVLLPMQKIAVDLKTMI